MGDTEKRTEVQKSSKDVWSLFQTIFSKLVAECARKELESSSYQKSRESSPPVDIRKTVTDAVGAVLTEPTFLEKVLDRQIKAYMAKNPPATKSQGPVSGNQQSEIKKLVGDFLSQNLATAIEKQLHATIKKEVQELLASNELKEMIDDKFRLISVYLKTDVIPKIVQKELSRSEARSKA